MTVRRLQQDAGLRDRQRPPLGAWPGRRRDDRGHVAGHQPLALSVPEHLDEHAAHLLEAGPGVAGLAEVLQEQRHVLGAELADPAGTQGGHEVLAHRPRPHLQRARRQLAAAVPKPRLGEGGDGLVPTGRGEAVLGVALHLAHLQQHLGARAAGDLLALPLPRRVGADVDERAPAAVLGVLEDRPLPRPTSRHGAPPVSCLARTARARTLAARICGHLSWLCAAARGTR